MTKKAKKHRWNVVCVKKYTYPMPNPVEFYVESKNLFSAVQLAKRKLKQMEGGWMVKSLYWLDPYSYEEKNNE
jgi:hypothetical protein